MGAKESSFPSCNNKVYGISSFESNSMRSPNPHSHAVCCKGFDAYQHYGYRQSDTLGTLTAGQNQSVRGDTQLIVDSSGENATCYGQSSFGDYKEGCGTLKANGGDIGGGQRVVGDTVGSLCARDYKGVGNQYVNEGKCIIQRFE